MDFNYQDNEASFSDMFSVFFDDSGITDGLSRISSNDESSDSGGGATAERNTEFWEAQHQLIHDSLHRTSSVEKRILAETEVGMAELRLSSAACSCSGWSTEGQCRKCVLRGIANRLREAGYNSALCNSKWMKSADIPSGEHSYIDVVVDTRKGKVRVVIELNFRAEFEMARASPEYNSLVGRLPEVFVGKSEKLRGLTKIVCAAAKKCMKANQMHLAPWRKRKYMQSKWLGTYQRMPAGAPLLSAVITTIMDRQPRQRTSMLTFDLHYNTSVKVL